MPPFAPRPFARPAPPLGHLARLGLLAMLFACGLLMAVAIAPHVPGDSPAIAERPPESWAQALVAEAAAAESAPWTVGRSGDETRMAVAVEGARAGTTVPQTARMLPGNAPNPATAWAAGSFPVENFQTYTSPFGYRRSATGGSGTEFHRGLDLAAPKGSYIRNWWSGRVTRVSGGDSCGTAVTIQSGQWTHVYCHMMGRVETVNGQRVMSDRSGGVQIYEGQTVPAGARIGRVGLTGRTTGPHLHWGIKYGDRWVDPALVLRAMYDNQFRAANPSGRASAR